MYFARSLLGIKCDQYTLTKNRSSEITVIPLVIPVVNFLTSKVKGSRILKPGTAGNFGIEDSRSILPYPLGLHR